MKKLSIVIVLILTTFTCIYAEEVEIGGESIGIQATYDGVLVSGFYDLHYDSNTYNNAASLQVQDVIVKVEETSVIDIDSFSQALANFTNAYNEVLITYIREQREYQTTIIVLNEGKVMSGLYVKDQVQGIGTITYYDENKYAALAHAISQESNEVLQSGFIYESEIHAISKGTSTQVGKKEGEIQYEQRVGDITKNSEYGIHGSLSQDVRKTLYEVGSIEDIEVGSAMMYTVIEGNVVQPFEIYIHQINEGNTLQSLEIEIIDKELLEKTGGIIQGMSGSPIVQNEKLIGAVSHVQTENPTKGYAIFIENMLESAESIGE